MTPKQHRTEHSQEWLKVTISKTADGLRDYMQVVSADLLAVNVVLVADKIEVTDVRLLSPKPKRKA